MTDPIHMRESDKSNKIPDAQALYDGPTGDIYRMLTCISKAARVEDYVFSLLQSEVERKGKKYEKALDLGCGDGKTTVRLLEAAQEIIGLDVSEQQILAANKHAYLQIASGRLKFSVDDMRALSIVGKPSFDLVTAFLSLHYCTIEELQSVFGSLSSMLLPGGQLVATINNPFQPEGGSIELGAISHFVSYEDAQKKYNAQITVDLYDEHGCKATTLTGVYHHDKQMWYECLEKAGFTEISFRGACDSLIVCSASKA